MVQDWMRVGVVVVAALAALASASAPSSHKVKRATVIESDFDDTWNAVVDVFADHNWDIEHIEKDSGIVTTDWLGAGKEADHYADCGSAPLANKNVTQVKFNVRVRDSDSDSDSDSDDATKIIVNTTWRQSRNIGDNYAIVACTSRGTLERQIQAEVTDAAASRARRRDRRREERRRDRAETETEKTEPPMDAGAAEDVATDVSSDTD